MKKDMESQQAIISLKLKEQPNSVIQAQELHGAALCFCNEDKLSTMASYKKDTLRMVMCVNEKDNGIENFNE